MDESKQITGTEAIDQMRKLKSQPGQYFGIRFITCDLTRKQYGHIRVYASCQLRTARRSEGLNVDSDHYLYFTDMETDEPRQCFKKLIRAVCFPPDNEWKDVKWFV